MLAHSFLTESSSKLLVTMKVIKARASLISGFWFPWPVYMFFEMRFDLGTLDSVEGLLPFGLLFLLCELSLFLVGNAVRVYRQWVPCEHNSSYSFPPIVLKHYRCFQHGMKMCMWLWYNTLIIFSQVFCFVNFRLFFFFFFFYMKCYLSV